MSYRPQFAYPTPSGCRDEEFTYYFDLSNNAGIAAGVTQNIGFTLQQDADFYWRGWKVDGNTGPADGLRWKDPWGNYFCFPTSYLWSSLYAWPSGIPVTGGSFHSGAPVVFEPEIYCPAGCVITLDTNAVSSINFLVSLIGVKRFRRGEGCS